MKNLRRDCEFIGLTAVVSSPHQWNKQFFNFEFPRRLVCWRSPPLPGLRPYVSVRAYMDSNLPPSAPTPPPIPPPLPPPPAQTPPYIPPRIVPPRRSGRG